MGLDLRENLPRECLGCVLSTWRDSECSLDQEVTGLIGKPDRSLLHQKSGRGRVLGLGVCG